MSERTTLLPCPSSMVGATEIGKIAALLPSQGDATVAELLRSYASKHDCRVKLLNTARSYLPNHVVDAASVSGTGTTLTKVPSKAPWVAIGAGLVLLFLWSRK